MKLKPETDSHVEQSVSVYCPAVLRQSQLSSPVLWNLTCLAEATIWTQCFNPGENPHRLFSNLIRFKDLLYLTKELITSEAETNYPCNGMHVSLVFRWRESNSSDFRGEYGGMSCVNIGGGPWNAIWTGARQEAWNICSSDPNFHGQSRWEIFWDVVPCRRTTASAGTNIQ